MPHRCQLDWRDETGHAPRLDRRRLRRILDRALELDGLDAGSLSVLVVDAAGIRALHRQHFGLATLTDVVSFPDGSWDPEAGCQRLGDVAICADIARRVAARRTRDPVLREQLAAEECLLYCVHGLLHCLGFDDQDPRDRRAMWRRQHEVLGPARSGTAGRA